ncbi:MAG: DUF3303 domain-containing protein [Planctomycetes bacterium]|nr:DUF3303 domain-containing protein [Planctomycetota bacterium]
MKFMVQFRLNPGSKKKAVESFERMGPNRNPGVAFRGAWIAVRSDVVFVLTESDDEALVAKVSEIWSEYGDCQIHPVIDVENF